MTLKSPLNGFFKLYKKGAQGTLGAILAIAHELETVLSCIVSCTSNFKKINTY